MTTEGIKVGDKVQFNIGEEVLIDVVTYVDSDTIEGERYDLTHVNLVVIEKSGTNGKQEQHNRDKGNG